MGEQFGMSEEASGAVRDLAALCGARWAGLHTEADQYTTGLNEEQVRAALRWVPALVGEALEFGPGPGRQSFLRAVAGQVDLWDENRANRKGDES